jgi:hypothetical protein
MDIISAVISSKLKTVRIKPKRNIIHFGYKFGYNEAGWWKGE